MSSGRHDRLSLRLWPNWVDGFEASGMGNLKPDIKVKGVNYTNLASALLEFLQIKFCGQRECRVKGAVFLIGKDWNDIHVPVRD